LGEINDKQQAAWRKTLDVFDEAEQRFTSMSLFPDDRELPADAIDSIQVRLSGLELKRPRFSKLNSPPADASFYTSPGTSRHPALALPCGRGSVGDAKTVGHCFALPSRDCEGAV